MASLDDVPNAPLPSTGNSGKATPPAETHLFPSVFLKEFLTAGVVSAASKTAVAPFERARLVMQTQGERIRLGRLDPAPLPGNAALSTEVVSDAQTLSRGSGHVSKTGSFIEVETVGRHPITTTRSSFKYCIENDGVAVGLFRGNSCTVARVFVTSATAFAVNGSLKAHLFFPERKYGYIRNFFGNVLLGGISGTVALAFAQPLDNARTRLAADVRLPPSMKHAAPRQFNNVRDVFAKTMKSDGLFGLYRGFGVSSFAVFVKTGLYFGVFDTFRPILPQYSRIPSTRRIDSKNASLSAAGSPPIVSPSPSPPLLTHDQQAFVAASALGWFSTITASTIGYPFETVRRRMMMTNGMEPRMKYRGSMHCLGKIIKLEGARGLMRGAMINAFTAMGGGLTLAAVDYGRRKM